VIKYHPSYLAGEMRRLGEATGIKILLRDAGNPMKI
jgi:hypothetical protein